MLKRARLLRSIRRATFDVYKWSRDLIRRGVSFPLPETSIGDVTIFMHLSKQTGRGLKSSVRVIYLTPTFGLTVKAILAQVYENQVTYRRVIMASSLVHSGNTLRWLFPALPHTWNGIPRPSQPE